MLLGAFIFRNVFVGVMVNNFDKMSEQLKEQEVESAKAKRFEKMRKKLNRELAVQGNIQKSITNLKAAAAGEDLDEYDDTGNLRNLNKDSDVLQSIQKLLVASHGISKGWENTVAETLAALAGSKTETMWSRDTLFKYLQGRYNTFFGTQFLTRGVFNVCNGYI
jgi:cation channel sperm-associated protein 2